MFLMIEYNVDSLQRCVTSHAGSFIITKQEAKNPHFLKVAHIGLAASSCNMLKSNRQNMRHLYLLLFSRDFLC